MKRLGQSPAFYLNLFRNGNCFKMGVCIAIALVWARFYSCHHDLAISDAIASLLLHINEPNKVNSGRTRKDEEVGLIPSLLAQFV
jgi:hypothetical protein